MAEAPAPNTPSGTDGGSPPTSSRSAPTRRLSWQMGLPLPLTLALRYLRSTRRDAYVTLLSALAGGGIALGVAALVLVLSGLSGLQSFLRNDVLSRTPHLEIEVPADTVIEPLVEQVAALPGVVEAQPLIRGRGWLLVSGGALDVTLVGYDGALPRFFPEASRDRLFTAEGLEIETVFEDSAEDPTDAAKSTASNGEREVAGLYLPDTLAIRWGIEVGQLVEIVSSRPTLTPFGPQPRSVRLPMVGSFRSGRLEDAQPRLALPLTSAERLVGRRQQRIEAQTLDLETALTVAEALPGVLPVGSQIATWQDLNRGLFFAFKLEKVLMFVSVFLIVPVAAMALVTVLALLISSKRGEIGMLRAMGTEPSVLRRAFLTLGSLLAVGGLTLGLTLGMGLAWLLDRYRLLRPPGDVYLLDHIPFLVLPRDVLVVALATLALTLASTFYAARKAAATPPVEALRG